MSLASLTKKATKALSKVPELNSNLLSSKAFALAALAFSLAIPNMAYAQSNSDKLKDIGGAAVVVGIFGWLTSNQNSINSATNSVITAVAGDAGNQVKDGIDSHSTRTRAALGKVTKDGVTGVLKVATDEVGVTSYGKAQKKATSYDQMGGLTAPTLNVPGVASSSKKLSGQMQLTDAEKKWASQLLANNKGSFFEKSNVEAYILMTKDVNRAKFDELFARYTNYAIDNRTVNSIANLQLLVDIAKVKYPNDNYKDAAIQALNNGTQLAFNR